MTVYFAVLAWINTRIDAREDDGFSTAELLGNAALGVGALVIIWAGLRTMGADLLLQMRTALGL